MSGTLSHGAQVGGGWADWGRGGAARGCLGGEMGRFRVSEHLLGARGCMWVAATPTPPEGATVSPLADDCGVVAEAW